MLVKSLRERLESFLWSSDVKSGERKIDLVILLKEETGNDQPHHRAKQTHAAE